MHYTRFVPPPCFRAPGPQGQGPHLPWSDPASRYHRARAMAADAGPKTRARHRPGELRGAQEGVEEPTKICHTGQFWIHMVFHLYIYIYCA